MEYDGIVGTAKSETWTAHVTQANGTLFSQTWTERAPIPGNVRFTAAEPRSEVSWRSPQLDKSSFRKIKKSGLIKMTNYDRGVVVVENNLIQVPRQSFLWQMHGAYTVKDNKTLFDTDTHIFDRTSDYWIHGDIGRFLKIYPLVKIRDFRDEIEDQKQSVMSQVINNLNSSYDPLTDLAELKETLNLLKSLLDAVHHPLKSFRDLRSRILSKNGSLRKQKAYEEIANLWMQYRYGIMPIVYSVKDVLEALKKSQAIYLTERGKRNIELSQFNPPEPTSTCLVESISGIITIRGTGKAMASLDSLLRDIDQISFNPFKTGWELIPYSFVVDWFVNVGDYIDAHLGSMVNFASQRNHCLAISSNYVRNTYFRDLTDERVTLTAPDWIVPWGKVFSSTSTNRGVKRDASYLLKSETFRTYERRIFSSSDVKLRFDPFLNWKRWIDAFVLGFAKTRTSLRHLK